MVESPVCVHGVFLGRLLSPRSLLGIQVSIWGWVCCVSTASDTFSVPLSSNSKVRLSVMRGDHSHAECVFP